MSEVSAKFFDLYMRGEALEEEIDDYVERWHQIAEGRAGTTTLADFLGMTDREYAAWAVDGTVLPRLIVSRATGVMPPQLAAGHSEELRLAARAQEPDALRALAELIAQRRSV